MEYKNEKIINMSDHKKDIQAYPVIILTDSVNSVYNNCMYNWFVLENNNLKINGLMNFCIF